MPSDIAVKICGLRDPATVAAAVAAGARYVGLNFFPKSPRFVSPETAVALAAHIPPGVAKVGLLVDPDDAELDRITGQVPLDLVQLHGHETPERVADVRARTGLPVIKALGVADADDLPALDRFGAVADMLLVDTKPPKGAVLSGGTGQTFDWGLIAGRRWPIPWMLAGGLTAQNVAQAIAETGAQIVDVSSGVERERGVKDPDMIAAFIRAAQGA